jgi:hypothetical protein
MNITEKFKSKNGRLRLNLEVSTKNGMKAVIRPSEIYKVTSNDKGVRPIHVAVVDEHGKNTTLKLAEFFDLRAYVKPELSSREGCIVSSTEDWLALSEDQNFNIILLTVLRNPTKFVAWEI